MTTFPCEICGKEIGSIEDVASASDTRELRDGILPSGDKLPLVVMRISNGEEFGRHQPEPGIACYRYYHFACADYVTVMEPGESFNLSLPRKVVDELCTRGMLDVTKAQGWYEVVRPSEIEDVKAYAEGDYWIFYDPTITDEQKYVNVRWNSRVLKSQATARAKEISGELKYEWEHIVKKGGRC